MSRFESPAFHQPEGRLPAAARRALLGAAALAFTVGLWLAVGAQAGHFGEQDKAVHVILPPVVIAGWRLPPDDMSATLGAGPVDVDCARAASLQDRGSRKGVNLKQ